MTGSYVTMSEDKGGGCPGDVREKYEEFLALFKRAHPNIPKYQSQKEANKVWLSIKKGKSLDMDLFRTEINRLNHKLTVKKKSMYDFLLTPKPQKSRSSESSVHVVGADDAGTDPQKSFDADADILQTPDAATGDSPCPTDDLNMNEGSDKDIEESGLEKAVFETPAQSKIGEELKHINERLVNLNEAKSLGIGDANVAYITRQIRELTEQKKRKVRKLKKLKVGQKASKKFRVKTKTVLSKAVQDFPALANQIKIRDSPGAPTLDETYPDLNKTILDIATVGAAASDRRRQELYRSVKTLDDLHKALQSLGFQLSRSALYLRLHPNNSTTREGKRHVRNVPVRYLFSFLSKYVS